MSSICFFLSDLNQNWIFWTDFRKTFKYKSAWKSVHWGSSCSMRKDRRDEANIYFSIFFERTQELDRRFKFLVINFFNFIRPINIVIYKLYVFYEGRTNVLHIIQLKFFLSGIKLQRVFSFLLNYGRIFEVQVTIMTLHGRSLRFRWYRWVTEICTFDKVCFLKIWNNKLRIAWKITDLCVLFLFDGVNINENFYGDRLLT